MAMMASPSTTWPFSSARMTRSASPSSASPRSAPVLADRPGHPLGVHRAAAVVDVLPVRLDAERDDLGAQLLEDRRGDLVGGPVGAVDHDGQPVERQLRGEERLEEDDVAADGVVDALGLADAARRWGAARGSPAPSADPPSTSRSISSSSSSGSLKPSREKNLMPLSWYGLWLALMTTPASARIDWVMKAMPGRGQRPAEQHVHAHGADARRRWPLQHVAGEAGVLADDDAVPVRRRCGPAQASARPSCSAISAVIGWTLATPRTPSVPKSFRSAPAGASPLPGLAAMDASLARQSSRSRRIGQQPGGPPPPGPPGARPPTSCTRMKVGPAQDGRGHRGERARAAAPPRARR